MMFGWKNHTGRNAAYASAIVLLLSQFGSIAASGAPRYGPVARFALDTTPAAGEQPVVEGWPAAKLDTRDGGLPALVAGAAPHTGKAWDFSRNNACLVAPYGPPAYSLGDIENTDGITLAFWVKHKFEMRDQNHRLMTCHGIDVPMNKGFHHLGVILDGVVHIPLSPGGRPKSPPVMDGAWHHVAVTADFRMKTQNAHAYIDGRRVNTVDGRFLKSFNRADAGARFAIGARSPGGAYPFRGSLDDVRFYDRALSDDEVLALFEGPVSAGAAREVWLPDVCALSATAPDGAAVQWSKQSGPGDVTFSHPAARTGTAAFSEPGEYELAFTAAGIARKMAVTVHAAQAPELKADGLLLAVGERAATLRAEVTIPGRPGVPPQSIQWRQVAGPEGAAIAAPSMLDTTVALPGPGVYRFELTAGYGGLDTSTTLDVYAPKAERGESYLKLLQPIYAVGFERPAASNGVLWEDLSGNTGYRTRGKAGPLPVMTNGARPFTGYAWDMRQSTAAVQVYNRVSNVGFGDAIIRDGAAVALWFRGDAEDIGRNQKLLGASEWHIVPAGFGDRDYGVLFQMSGTEINRHINKPEGRLFDNEWHHLAVSLDFRAATNNITYYLDGAAAGSDTHVIEDLLKDGFKSVRVDHWHIIGARTPGWQSFSGDLDDVAVFDRALSAADIALLYNGPSVEQLTELASCKLTVDAGRDQAVTLPAARINLRATVAGAPRGTSFLWEQVSGPGKVVFADADDDKTKATVQHAFDEISPDYAEYVLRFTATTKAGIAVFDETVVSFYTPSGKRPRKLSATPTPGVHPRVLFTAEDLPGMRERARTVPVAVKALERVRATTWGQLNNVQGTLGYAYSALRDGNESVDVVPVVENFVGDVYSNLGGGGTLYGHLWAAGLVALIDEDTDKLQELGLVLSRLAAKHLAFYEPNYENALTHEISATLGMAYDVLFNSMTDEQRRAPRELLSRMTRFRQSCGTAVSIDADNSTNWKAFHDHMVLATLAIEGERGYDSRVYETHKRKQRAFLTRYGAFTSGCAHEGWGYFFFGMSNASLTGLAVARRDENFFETTNLPRALDAMFRQVAPFDRAIRANGDTIGGRIDAPQALTWVARHMYPDDPAVAYLQDGLTDGLVEGTKDQRGLNALGILFGAEANMDTTQQDTAEAAGLPLDLFCRDTGLMSCRSSWADDAVHLTFRCRTDKYFLGHMHPDVNSFELWANGREWFIDPGKYAGQNDLHATVLIDGIGGGGCLNWWTWPSLPGIFESFTSSDQLVMGVGNAKPFYDYTPHQPQGPPKAEPRRTAPALKSEPVVDHGLRWRDFIYRDDGKSPVPYWREKPVGYDFGYMSGQAPIYSYNPVLRARRTAALVRGMHPFVIIADDIQKDDAPHRYTWIANMPRRDEIVVESQDQTSMVLRHKDDDTGGARLLVKVLSCKGKPKLELEEFVIETSSTPVTRMAITVDDVVRPDFVVMLYPFDAGSDPLPDVSHAQGGITVQIGNQTNLLRIKQAADGQREMEAVTAGTPVDE